MQNTRKTNKFFKSKENLEDDDEIKKLKMEIRNMRTQVHNLYEEKWNLMKRQLESPVRYEQIPRKEFDLSSLKVQNVRADNHEIEMNMKIHELFGSHAEWLSDDEIVIHFSVPTPDKLEKYSMKLKKNEHNMWSVVKSYFPVSVNVEYVFDQFASNLTYDELAKVVREIRNYCFAYHSRMYQFKSLKEGLSLKGINVSASACYQHIDIQVRMLQSKREKYANVLLTINFTRDGVRPRNFTIKSEDLSEEENSQLMKQLKPLRKYDLLYGFEISMLKAENTIFLLEQDQDAGPSGSFLHSSTNQSLINKRSLRPQNVTDSHLSSVEENDVDEASQEKDVDEASQEKDVDEASQDNNVNETPPRMMTRQVTKRRKQQKSLKKK